ncbi:hypothetical protein A9Q02_04935 [Candidatus Chloroploca asiatica]|uniref:Glycosyltransferase RgtA/B/C/D-like domain-containing protein n=2 Tax=Candidatus Chloroploca asiatica TaxID=1506545 RepID=A0A2H3KHL7_9CHLR|nr:hypothetical protein A9Q02_04935 [Candidatus Chloroploca asiatica]
MHMSYISLVWLIIALMMTGFMVLVLPGLALLALFDRPERRRSWFEQLSLAIGISLAWLPVWLLWTDMLGWHLGAMNVWLPALLSVVVLVWHGRHQRRPNSSPLPLDSYDIALGALFLLIVVVRLAIVAPLEAPMWGDAYHHTMIAQLIIDNGGLFRSWEPYAPYQTFTVQFGFPAMVAGFPWVTGISTVEAVLVTGQLLNAAAALVLYPLAVRLADGRRVAGLVAVLVAGLLTVVPSFYVNWGRYAQLAGQVILPIAMVLTWEMFAAPRPPWRSAGLLGLVVAGMTLSYYRMGFFYAAFIVVLVLCWVLPHWRTKRSTWLQALPPLILAALVAAGLLLPWVFRVTNSLLADMVSVASTTGVPTSFVWHDYQNWQEVTTYIAPLLLWMSGLAVAWALVRRAWMIVGLVLWIGLLVLYFAGTLVGLPGAVMLQSFSVMIAIYMPVALLCGWLAAEMIAFLPTPRLKAVLPLIAVVLLAAWGALQQRHIVDPFYAIVTQPDMKAMDWIKRNTKPTDLFLVQGFTIFQGTSAVGADAGWWIPLLTGRQNTMPPQYPMLSERPDPPDYTQRVVDLVLLMEARPLDDAEVIDQLCAWGVTYAYYGQRQGQAGFGAEPLFRLDDLHASPYFTLMHTQDEVAIFAFDQAVCSSREGRSVRRPAL